MGYKMENEGYEGPIARIAIWYDPSRSLEVTELISHFATSQSGSTT
jgi:hypothetical protein